MCLKISVHLHQLCKDLSAKGRGEKQTLVLSMNKGRHLFSLYQIFSPIFHALSRKKEQTPPFRAYLSYV